MITSITITKVEAKSYQEIGNTVMINHDFSLGIPLVNKPDGVINFQINFKLHTVFTNPNRGYVLVEGSIGYRDDGNPLDISQWNNPEDTNINNIKTEVANSIMDNIIPVTMPLVHRMGLPPMFQMPRIQFGSHAKGKEPSQSYIG
ncbi:MAG: hypothetical protein WC623_21765 [Pedobacter sp.]|uniref:hypothetical protein n=1 Tax=Pedobacter sp. TaxID=1411316 RepID=UPI0035690A1B